MQKFNEYTRKNSRASSSDTQKNIISVGELGDDQSTTLSRVNEVDEK